MVAGHINRKVLNDFLWGLRYVGFGEHLSAIYSCGKGASIAGVAPVYKFYKVSSPLCCLTFLGGKKEFDYTPFYIETEEVKKLMIRLKQGNQCRFEFQRGMEELIQRQVENGESLDELKKVTTVIAKTTTGIETAQSGHLEKINENISSAEKNIAYRIDEISTLQVLTNNSCSAIQSIVASTQSEIKEVHIHSDKINQSLQNVNKTVIVKSGETNELLAHLIDGKSNYETRLAVERAHLTKQLNVIIDNIVRSNSSLHTNPKDKKEALLFSEELQCILFSLGGRSSDEIVEMLEQNAPEGRTFRKNTDPSKITRMKKSAILSLNFLGILSGETLLPKTISVNNYGITEKRKKYLRLFSTDLTMGVDKKNYSNTLERDSR